MVSRNRTAPYFIGSERVLAFIVAEECAFTDARTSTGTIYDMSRPIAHVSVWQLLAERHGRSLYRVFARYDPQAEVENPGAHANHMTCHFSEFGQELRRDSQKMTTSFDTILVSVDQEDKVVHVSLKNGPE